MKPRNISAFVALTLCIGVSPPLARTQQNPAKAHVNEVINQSGRYISPDGSCHAALDIASMGGFLILSAGKASTIKLRVEDVTGMAWVAAHTLVYTTSPIYGIPGVFVYSCDSTKGKRIVAPRTKTEANPDGEDYFELQGTSATKPTTVYFYYAPSVESVDFNVLRTPAYLYEVHLDGSNFRKASGTPK